MYIIDKLLFLVGLLITYGTASSSDIPKVCRFKTTSNYQVLEVETSTDLNPIECKTGYHLLDSELKSITEEKQGILYKLEKINDDLKCIGEIYRNPIPGYYMVAGQKDKFIHCDNNNCKYIDTPTETCSNSNIGKLVIYNEENEEEINEQNIEENLYGLCLGVFKENPAILKFENNNESYLVKRGGPVFNFDITTDYFVVKAQEDRILFDDSFSRKKNQVALINAKLVTRFEEFCKSDKSSGKYYTCMNGKCISFDKITYERDTTSLIKDNCEFTVIKAETEYDDNECFITTGKTCNENNYGYHLGTDDEGLKYLVFYNSTCSVVDNPAVGYYKNAINIYENEGKILEDGYNSIIECKKINNGVSCQLINPPNTEGNTCDVNNSGELIDTNFNVILCLDIDIPQRFADKGKAFVIGTPGSIFGIENYFPLNVTRKYMIYDEEFSGSGILDNGGRVNCNENHYCEKTECKIKVKSSLDSNLNIFNYIPSLENCDRKDNGFYFNDEKGNTVKDKTKNGYIIKYDANNASNRLVLYSNQPGYYKNQDKVTQLDYPYIKCKQIKECLNSNPTCDNSKLVTKLVCNLLEKPTSTCITGELVEVIKEDETTSIELCVDGTNSVSIPFSNEKKIFGLYANLDFDESINYYAITVDTDKIIIDDIKNDGKFNYLDAAGYVGNSDGEPISKRIINCSEISTHNGLITFNENCNQINDIKQFGYYLTNVNSTLIYCNESKNCMYSESNNQNYVIDAGNNGYIIKKYYEKIYYSSKGYNYYNVNNGFNLIHCDNTCKKEIGIGRRAYLLGNTFGLIICDKSSCIDRFDISLSNEKYYLNGGYDKGTNPIITKDENEYKWITTKGKEGTSVYINGNGSELKNAIIYCSNENNCVELDAEKNKKYINVSDHNIIICSDNGCTILKDIFNDISKDSNLTYLINPSNNQILEDNSVNGKLVICEYKTGIEITKNCHIEESNYLDYYVNTNDDSLIQKTKDGLSIVSKENVDYGYYFNKNSINYINCFDNGCYEVLAVDSCAENIGYLLKSNMKLCTGDEETLSTTGKHIMSGFTGKSETLLLNIELQKITIISNTKDEYYLVDKSSKMLVTLLDKEGTLYKCKNGICDETHEPGIYLNADINTTILFQYIICDANGCKSTNISNENYCFSESNSKLYLCNDTCDNMSDTTCKIHFTNNGYYVSSKTENDILINCTNNTCKKEKPYEGYYINGEVENPLIKCENSVGIVRCYTINNANNGYYLSGNSNNIIKCNGKICNEVDNPEGYYYSGEKGLIQCIKNDQNISECNNDSKPLSGWYINGDSNNEDGKYIIYCKTDNNCEERKIPNEGYLLSAYDSGILINCSNTNKCEEYSVYSENNESSGYYINGENGKLFYCDGTNGCSIINPQGYSWYLTFNSESDGNLIGCDENEICTLYSNSQLGKGYYLIDDPAVSSYKSLIILNSEDKYIIENKIKKGWYINADNNANSKHKVIQCSNSMSCSYVEIKDTQCLSSINGKFTEGYDDIKWCNGDTPISLDKNIELVVKISDNFIPGVLIPENKSDETYAILEVDSGNESISLVQKYIDGYFYDENSKKLFLCSYTYGICFIVKENNIVDGYYFNHTPNTGKDNKVIRCENKKCTFIMKNDINDCDEKNIYISENDNELLINLCTDNKINNAYNIINNDIDKVYALKSYQFPGVSGRYVLVNLNKYYITKKEEIEEINICSKEEKKTKTDVDKVCLQKLKEENNVKYSLYNRKKQSIITGNIEINSNNVISSIKYAADTNNGYLIYECSDENVELKKIYIDKDTYKYECVIGDQCIEKEKSEEPILGYDTTTDNILKMYVRNSNSALVVDNKIKPGFYVNKSNMKIIIKCDDNGKCVEVPNDKIKKIDDDTIKVNNVISSSLDIKFILDKINNNDEDYVLYELTHASYTVSEVTQPRNVFIDNDNIIISSERKEIRYGYTCINGKCSVISKNGINRYYLNTVQSNKKENAVVRCGNGSCEFLNAIKDNVYENAAAQSMEDGLIKCYSEKCITEKVKITMTGLPDCKISPETIDTDIFKPEISQNGRVLRDDTSSELLEGQYCYLQGNIYGYDGNGLLIEYDNYDDIEYNNEDFIFDATFRKLDISEIGENHIGASLYKCVTATCYLTYGYVINGKNYSKCSQTGCIYYDFEKQNERISSCDIAGSGNIIYDSDDNDVIKLCISNSNKLKFTTAIDDKYYHLEININDNFPESSSGDQLLINIKKDKTSTIYVASVIVSDLYTLIDEDDKLVNKKEGKMNSMLYSCNSSNRNCISVDNKQHGYFISDLNLNDITCKGPMGCDGCTNTEWNIFLNIYFNMNEVSYYGSDDDTLQDYEILKDVIYEVTSLTMTVFNADNYILLNTLEKRLATDDEIIELKDLYRCNSSLGKCKKVDPNDGWYVSGDPNYKVIECKNGACIMHKTLPSRCSYEGELIFNTEYIFCYLKTSSSGLKLSENSGISVYLTQDNQRFPNGKDYIIINSNSVIGIGKKSIGGEAKSLITCSKVSSTVCTKSSDGNPLETGKYCIYDNSIYSNNSTNCVKQFTQKNTVSLFDGSDIINNNNTEKINIGTQMYYCSDGKCRLATGYKKINNIIYSCKSEGCKVAEESDEKGYINSEKRLNVDNTKATFISNSNNLNTYHYISDSNDFPGSDDINSVLIEAGSDYFVIFKGYGYYLIDSKNNMLYQEPEKAEGKTKRAIDHSGLYYCEKINGSCTKEQIISNGYYINGAAEETNKAIIGCNEGKCNISDNVEKTCDKIGRLIRQDDKSNYKLCNTKTNAGIEINSANNNIKYYSLTLSRNDEFEGISIPDNDTYNDINVNIIIEVTDQYIKQYIQEGYIIFNSVSNKIIEKVNESGSLYYCKKSEDLVKTVQCNPVVDINNGWYFNNIYGDKRFIICVDKECKIMEAIERKKCIESGSLVYNNNKFKLCETIDKQIDIMNNAKDYVMLMTISNKNEFPGVIKNNINIITNISNNSITSLKFNTYFVVNDDKIVITSSNENSNEGKLYKCTITDGCVPDVLAKDNWYIKTNNKGENVELIKCKSRKCQLVEQKYVMEGFRISANKNLPLIQCITPGNEINNEFIVTGSTICEEKDYKEGWYLESDTPNKLINCDKELGCYENIINNGWYINNGADNLYSYGNISNATVYPIIKCKNDNCISYNQKIEEKCTKAGELILEEGNYKLCISDVTNDTLSSVDFTKVSGKEYHITNIANKDDFPDASSGLILVKITKNEIIQVKNEGYYYYNDIMFNCNISGSCSKVTNNGITVLNELNHRIYTSSDCNDGKCNWIIYEDEGMIFLDNDRKIIREEGKETSINIIYKCKMNNSTILICMTIREIGYYYNNYVKDNNNKSILYKYDGNNWSIASGKVQNCTSLTYKDNYCYIGYNDEPYADDDTPLLKIKAGDLCKTIEGDYYIALKEINTGIDEPNCAQVLMNSNTSYYYNVNNVAYVADRDSVYEVKNENVVDFLNSNVIGNDIDKDKILPSYNKLNEYTINCKDKVCKFDKSVKCTYNFQSGYCKLNSGSIEAGQTCTSNNNIVYLALENLSSSTEGSCTPYIDSYSYESVITKIIDENNYKVINNNMYSIDNNNNVYKEDEGIYLIDNADKLVEILDIMEVDISEKSNFKFYVCNGDGCNLKTSCGIDGKIEYIYDKRKKSIIKCDPTINTISYIKKEGYYLNSPWNNLIKCYEDGLCNEITTENGMEGYYLNAGNENMIIKCIRGNECFTCEEEKIIPCIYNSKDETCKSEINLLRNSYCYYSDEDKGSGTINKLLYVENFIKSGDEGKCIVNDNNSDYFFKYKNSKFLGHEERNDLIKFSKDSIVSIYENDVGYYIISTESNKGIEVDTYLKKTRIYECKKHVCEEILSPENGKIYINMASVEKMIKYNEKSKKWNVIKHRCDVNPYNTYQCKLSVGINEGDILYTVINDSITFYLSTLDIPDNVRTTAAKNYHHLLEKNTYQFTNNEMYLFNNNTKSFDWIDETGYYIFNNDNKIFNLIPYKGTENITLSSSITIYKKENDYWNPEISSSTLNNEGYYWNKADTKNEGIIIQSMNVPYKKENKDDTTTNNIIKSVINKCTSTMKGVCVNAQDGQTIPNGSACVVVEGEFRGLYLATASITKSSTQSNCIKYDEGATFSFINKDTEFAGEPHSKIIIKVDENEITPFKNDGISGDIGYYIFDKNQKPYNNLNTSESFDGSVFKCGNELQKDETTGEAIEGSELYQCNYFLFNDGYYYANPGLNVGGVYYHDGNKWSKETKYGYFFFNDKDLPATTYEESIDDIVYDRYGGSEKIGKYINSAVTDKIIVIENNGNYNLSIDPYIKQCNVELDNICESIKSDITLDPLDICYSKYNNNVKLNIVEITNLEGGDSVTKCYTGSESNIKYYLINNSLYKLDGFSVQNMDKGIFVLNDKWEEFSSEYPETPSKVVLCENYNNCKLITNEGINTDSNVIINAAGSGVNQLLKYYSTINKYINIYQPGYYFFNKDGSIVTDEDQYLKYEILYELTENGELKKLKEEDVELNNIYINYAKEGSLTYQLKNLINSDIVYNSEIDRLSYRGIVNEDPNENILVFINNRLYRQLPKEFDEADEGLYAVKDNKPFTMTKWSTLYISSEICYYDKEELPCNGVALNIFKKQKYMINKATGKESIIEYNTDSDEWRMVDTDGYYFFFEDNYSINKADSRINKVLQIVNGDINDISKGNKKSGFYVFNDLMVENTSNKWEDAESIVSNVISNNKKQCTAYEANELIEQQEFCYDSQKGLCIPKKDITDKTDYENNCIFSEKAEIYYYLINDNLYAVNHQGYSRIDKSGFYIIDKSNKIYSNEKENKVNVYECIDDECENAEDLSSSKYYLNMANDDIEKPIILYYNKDNNTWRKTSENGYYFFNKSGESISAGENVAYAYYVKDDGNTIENIINNIENGKYISQSDPETEIIIEMKDKWQKAETIPFCKVDTTTNVVTSKNVMKEGDVCIYNKKLVLIKGISSEKAKRDEEIVYQCIINEDVIYYYATEEQKIIKVENNKVSNININGYAFIDKNTLKPIESIDIVDADLYKCTGELCELVSSDSVKISSRYIDALSEKFPLVRNIDKDKWMIENVEGYYFLNSEQKPVSNGDIVSMAYEVEKINDIIIQNDIIHSKEAGFFLNKANENETKVVVSNNGSYWSKGENIRACDISVNSEGSLCKSISENEKLDKGGYCYSMKDEQIYLITSEANGTSITENGVSCITATLKEPLYLTYSEAGGKINGVSIGRRFVKINGENIEFAKPGYYILNQDGRISNETNESVEDVITYYKCNEEECEIATINDEEIFLSATGIIYKYDKKADKLIEIINQGIYFFDAEGKACINEKDKIETIIEINSEGVKHTVDMNELDIGVYINEANSISVGKYNGKKWDSIYIECNYEKETNSCANNNLSLDIGDYCVYNGVFYVIHKIDEETNLKHCVPGNNEKPIYLINNDNKLMIVKEKKIGIVNEEGYYAIESSSLNSLEANNFVSSKFIKCEYGGGECSNIEPSAGSYLNRAGNNIVQYPSNNVDQALTTNKKCDVRMEDNHYICSSVNNEEELNVGDICIGTTSNHIYLVSDKKGECIVARKTIDTYKFINNKLYKINDDSVIQLLDGYYFVDSNGHAINDINDYNKPGTVGYICSKVGNCYIIQPEGIKYFADYTTMNEDEFYVIKYNGLKKDLRKRYTRVFDDDNNDDISDENFYIQKEGNKMDYSKNDNTNDRYVYIKYGNNNLRKRDEDEEEDSGFEYITKEGIYKLDDGSYAECEYNNNDDLKCHTVENEGVTKTIDDELIICKKNDDNKIECTQAVQGGYYIINDELLECEPNEDGDQLVCTKMNKEGYFLAEPGEILYQCVEKEDESDEDEYDDEDESDEYEDETIPSGGKDDNNEGEDDSMETSMIANDEDDGDEDDVIPLTADSGYVMPTETPYDNSPMKVDCSVVVCSDEPIIFEDEGKIKQMYVCKNVYEDDETKEEEKKWISETCSSGNYIKINDGYYKCEDEKESLDEEYIEKPNESHTTSVNTYTEEKTSTNTPSSTDDSQSQSPTNTVPPDSSAQSFFNRLPSLTFYIILFIIALLIQYN
ncbi:scaffoldin [Anaeromyces robustus]|uniref:Scaffoldin n=1 Tax=Anaeromyces robustus TaxID=1754192 RepID=A0A1Y1WSZ6_9FUNG|nr:scaffoldin [Anaeromyces robustus]|eukprot:ORX76366.1 scaffoldin [Anaeromyces robustus]